MRRASKTKNALTAVGIVMFSAVGCYQLVGFAKYTYYYKQTLIADIKAKKDAKESEQDN
jgi:hypothetical protein